MTKSFMEKNAKHQQKVLNAPVKITCSCHPGASVDVHVDGVKWIVYLTCSKCDRLITKIKAKP